MRSLLAALIFFVVLVSAPSALAANSKTTTKVVKPQIASVPDDKLVEKAEKAESVEKQRAIDDVNMLIIDSYKARLDKTLNELYDNIRIATKGDRDAQIKILTKVRADLDDKLDALADADVSENRKKILLGVYFYLKTSIEAQIHDLTTIDDNK